MFDYLGVAAVLALIGFFTWLAVRSWRAQRGIVKWVAGILTSLLAVASTGILVVALVGYAKLNRKYDNPVPTVSVDVTPENIARGERFGLLCAGCHAADEEPPLEGLDFLADDDAPPIGTFYAPNLTPTHLGEWTDGEIIRAIREGIHRDGRSLLIMPASMFRSLSDDDVAGIVAFLRSQPAVEPDTPHPRFNLLGAIMLNFAPIFEAQPPVTEPVIAPAAGPTPEYGGYLASYACEGCHGEDLGGDAAFSAPGLISVGLTWSEEGFFSFFRTGLKPDSVAVDGELMPWEDIRKFMTDEDLQGVFAYITQFFASSGD